MGYGEEKEIKELREYCRKIDTLVKQKGPKFEYCDARYKAAVIYKDNGYKDFAYRQTLLAKNELHQIVKHSTKSISPDQKGFDLFELDDYCKEHEVETAENKLFWDLLYLESQDIFDSYLLYLEKDREPKERFYYPKRDCLRKTGIVQGMQDLEDDVLNILTISLPPGTGKAGRLSAKVLTPTGFVRMGDIKQGDKVIAGNGNVTTVLGVFPQGKKPCYRVYMDDGSYTEASGDHLWQVQTRDDRNKKRHPNGKYRVVTTDEMRKNLKVENGKRLNFSIDYVPRIEFAEKPFTIHPYVLGVLLGDGCLSQNDIILTSPDKEIVNKVNELLLDGYSFVYHERYDYRLRGSQVCERANRKAHRNVIKLCLDVQGLHGAKSDTKFIPKEYLYASYEQRLWLLRGLLDTDGYADKGNIEYTTASKQLAEDVRELVHSLGGYCSVIERETGYKDENGDFKQCKNSFRMTIQFTSEQPKPFYLSRKADRYNPKRSEMKRFVTDIEYIGEEECQCIYIEDDCHLYITDDYIITHNTTLLKFFATWVMGKRPDSYSIFYSHSDDITRMFYDGVLDIIKSDEYKYSEIFPKVFIQNTNAKGQRINLNNYKPFESLQCTTVGAKNSGKVRVSSDGYLFCDDLIGGIEEALNKSRLDTLWGKYGTDARQRKKDGAKEIMIATRWSVHDCIGRLQLIYRTDPKVRFIAVPGINKETGKSNFEYKYDGFSVEFYEDQQKCMDDISYKCLYDNEPIEREGILYHADELRRYENLPNREPDAVYSIGDVKNKGTDFMVFPVIAQYGNDYYCVDCVCDDDPDFGIQQQKVASLFFRNKVQIAEFESNNGGDRFSSDVDEVLKKMGGFTHITSKFTESNKEARIFANAFWVKQNILFKQDKLYGPKEDYGIMMSWLCRYSVVGKNEHDDVPDCFANIALYFQRGLQQATVTPVFNPFRMSGY